MTKEPSNAESAWLRWWRELQDDRAGRAELRRCGGITEVAFAEPFHLLRRMKGNPTADIDLKKLALVAAVLSHVDDNVTEDMTLAASMAAPSGEKALVSDSRFRQILRTEAREFDDRLRDVVRVVHQLGRRASVHRLAEDLWWWNERTRRTWALDYYERASPEKTSKAEP